MFDYKLYVHVCVYIYIFIYVCTYVTCTSICIIFIISFVYLAFLSISLQPSYPDQNTVGKRQDVTCLLSLSFNVDLDTIELAWYNEDDIVTDDDRVTINIANNYYNDSTLATVIQFDPLFEEDEGEYICYAVINDSFTIDLISLKNFTSKKNMYLCMKLHIYIIYIIIHVHICNMHYMHQCILYDIEFKWLFQWNIIG